MSRVDDDSSLVAEALRGEREAFASLVERHLRPAFGIAYAFTGSAHDSEDIVQEAFLRAYRNLARLRRGNFGPWLGGIVRHLASDWRRARERRERMGEELQLRTRETDDEGPDGGAMEREEEERLVRGELAALPDALRLPLVLYYFEEQSTERVAARLGIRPAAARKRLQLARDRLRGRLLARFEGAMARVAPRTGLKRSIIAAIAALPFVPGGKTGAASAGVEGSLLQRLMAGGMIVGTKKAAAFLAAAILSLVGGVLIVADPMHWRSGGDDSAPPSRKAVLSVVTAVEQPAQPSPEKNGAESAVVDDADAKAPLFGIVLGTDGEPAAGVVVTAYRLGRDEGAQIEWRAELPRATSGEKGEFRLEEIEEGPWGLVAVAARGGHAVFPRVVVPTSAAVVMRLEAAGDTLEGVVMDVEDHPLPGAEIRIASAALGRFPCFPMHELKLLAGDDGAFRLPSLPAGGYTMKARHTAHWPAEAGITVPTKAPIEIRLKHAACVEGHVYLRDRSHPLKNGEVSIRNCTPTGSSGTGLQTGPEGEFTSDPMYPGEHSLVFQYEQFQPVPMHVDLTLSHPLRGVEIVFVEGTTVRGTVRNKAGDFLPGADLYWKRPGACSAEEVACVSDMDGRFEVSGLAAGKWTVLMDGLTDLDHRTMAVELTEVAAQELDVVMDVPSPVRVLVTDTGGTPVAGVEVEAHVQTPRISGNAGAAMTNATGRVTFVKVPAEGTMELKVGSDEIGWATAFLDLAQWRGPITLRLEPLGKIVGRVLDAEGNGVVGAVVSFSSSRYFVADYSRIRTDSRGEFVAKLFSGEYIVGAMGGILGAARIDRVVASSGHETPLEIHLDASRTIRGHLLGPDGRPVGNPHRHLFSMRPRVFLYPEASGKQQIEAEVDPEGWFAAIVERGSYNVTANAPGLQQRQLISGVRASDPPVEVQLEPPPVRVRRVTGKVLDNGRPVEGVAMRYYRLPDLHSFGSQVVTGLGGAFELENVDADRIVVVGSCPSFAFARSAEVQVPQEGTTEGVLVTVVDGADLEIRVKGVDGQPAANAEIDISVEHAIAAGVIGATDADGICRLRRVPAAEYHLQVQSADWTKITHQNFSWSADGTPIDVVLGHK